MRKIIYFNKENSKLLDKLSADKLEDFSKYVCDLIRKDLENEEMKNITSDLQEIKQKLNLLEMSIVNALVIPSDEKNAALDVDKLLWK